MFAGVTSFNQSLDRWNVSSVTDMAGTFEPSTSYNQPLNSSAASSVTNMSCMFNDATSFNELLDNWDVKIFVSKRIKL